MICKDSLPPYPFPTDDLAQQSLGLLLPRQGVGADLFQRAQRLRLVEVARETDRS